MLVMGDIHGQIAKVRLTLRRAGIVDEQDHWIAGNATMWFLGDFFDRGPDGIAAVDLVRSLQREAAVAGGRVDALLGNHDILILAAQRFGTRPSGGPGGTFLSSWQLNGGVEKDLARLTPDRAAWIRSLPAIALERNHLLIHADATFYQNYGRSVEEVNRHIRAILESRDDAAWDLLLDYFSQRRAFQDPLLGPARVGRILALYGGQVLVHGHTPISNFTGCTPESVTAAHSYATGLATNVDGGMYLGGCGFVAELPELGPAGI